MQEECATSPESHTAWDLRCTLPFPAQKPALLPTFDGVGLNVDRQLLGGQVSWHPQRQDLKGGEGSKARHAGQQADCRWLMAGLEVQ